MSRRRLMQLTQEQTERLLRMRDHELRPYLRIKAAAILKVAAGKQIQWVAAEGLPRPYSENTVRHWLNAYEQGGEEALLVQPGRGRKPAFFPCA